MSGKGHNEEGQKALRPKHFDSEEVSSAQWDAMATAMTDSPRLKALEEKTEKATTNENASQLLCQATDECQAVISMSTGEKKDPSKPMKDLFLARLVNHSC